MQNLREEKNKTNRVNASKKDYYTSSSVIQAPVRNIWRTIGDQPVRDIIAAIREQTLLMRVKSIVRSKL